MYIETIKTGSSGNTYILGDDNEALILDAGCKFMEVKKALGFDIRKIKGVLVTHEHG